MFENENGAKRLLYGILFAVGSCIAISLILIPFSALVLSFTPDPSPLIFPVSAAILYISSAAGGFIGNKLSEKLVTSMVSGLIAVLLILLFSAFFKGESGISPVGAVFAYIGIFAAFFAGGLLSMLISNSRPKRQRRRHRR